MTEDPSGSEPGHSRSVQWYGVRCLFGRRHSSGRWAYEERITIWRARDMAMAVRLAEAEADLYAADSPDRYLGFAQCFSISGKPNRGAEVFSLIRLSDLDPEDYLSTFFDTGDELQGPSLA